MKKDPLDAILEADAPKADKPTKGGKVDPLDAVLNTGQGSAPNMAQPKPPEPDAITADDFLQPSNSAVTRASLGMKPSESDSVGYNKAQRDAQAQAARTNTPEAQDPQAQAILSGVLGAGAGSAVSSGVSALGAPALAPILGSGTASATGTALTGGSKTDVAKSFGLGAILGAPAGAKARVANQPAAAAERQSMPFLRAANEKEQRDLLDIGKDQISNVLQKYKIGSIKDPLVARDAVTEGIQRAKDAVSDAGHSLGAAKAMNNPTLVKEATAKVAEATRELQALQALEPGITRAATAHEMRQSWIQRLADKPVATIKSGVSAVATSPLRAGMAVTGGATRAADKALAALIRGRQLGLVTPEMINQAAVAGVAPNVLGQFKPTTIAQGAPNPVLPPSPFK